MLLNSLIILVIVEHIWFMIFEMFMWNTPYARKAFGMSKELAEGSKKLAKNQGLYNGFLAAGLIWAMMMPDPNQSTATQAFFLCCVSVAGVFGALTANFRIFFIQAVPALIALALLFI